MNEGCQSDCRNNPIDRLADQILWAAREMFQRGLVVGAWGNISLRLATRCGDGRFLQNGLAAASSPGALASNSQSDIDHDNLILITPSGMDYNQLQKTDLVAINLEGQIIQGHRHPSTEMALHLAIYRQRPEIRAIVHTHSVFASALAVARIPLPPILEELAQLLGQEVPVSEYALAGTEGLAENAVRALGQGPAVLLTNHGLVGVGKTVREALMICQVVEKGAQVYIFSRILGSPRVLSSGEVRQLREEYLYHYGQK
jgi:L-fuculose-phosphate aldolase